MDTRSAIASELQSDFRANGHNPKCGRRGNGFGFSVSSNLTHAHVAREKKPAAQKPKPAAPVAPAVANPPSPVGRLLATYADVIDAFRARALELELSRLETDHLSGLWEGHSSHLLAKKFTQVFGPVSLPLMLDTLGLRLLVIEDPELTARTLKRRKPRVHTHVRHPRESKALNKVSPSHRSFPT